MELNPEVVLAEPGISVVHGPLRSSWASECVCVYICVCMCVWERISQQLLGHRWQTQGPGAESGPPPCFIWPSSLFPPGGSAELLAPS